MLSIAAERFEAAQQAAFGDAAELAAWARRSKTKTAGLKGPALRLNLETKKKASGQRRP